MKADVLFFSEDPGAANYLAPLPGACEKKGFSSQSIAAGKAKNLYTRRNLSFEKAENFFAAGHVFDTVETKLLVVGSSEKRNSLGLQLVDEAKRRRIRTVGAVDAFMNAAQRFQGEGLVPLAHAPEWLMVPDEWVKKEFTGLGFEPEKVIVCGHPQYDYVKETAGDLAKRGQPILRKQLFPGAMKGQTIAVFVAEQHGGLNQGQFIQSDEYTLQGNGGTTRNEIVLEEFLSAVQTLKKKPYLVLRLHPKSKQEEFKPYLNSFDHISTTESVLELLYASDCVFGMTTMLLIEASILGKPTFSILPRKIERNWLPTIRSGTTVYVTTRDALIKKLPEYLNNAAFYMHKPDEHFIFGASCNALKLFESLLTASDPL